MTQTTMMETELLTRRIVIFGATGDLCKKKLIPALYKLWQKKLLPHNILIVGASRRELPKEVWLEKLGATITDIPHQGITPKTFAQKRSFMRRWLKYIREINLASKTIDKIKPETTRDFGLWLKLLRQGVKPRRFLSQTQRNRQKKSQSLSEGS